MTISIRRRLLQCAAALLAGAVLPVRGEEEGRNATVRIGLTPVFLDDQIAFLNLWQSYLEERLDRQVAFHKRASYREVVDLLQADKLDFAWLCGYPFVRHRDELRLLAVPLYNGRPLYQSYLIVPARDSRSMGIADLKNSIFAYADPDSNSGYLYTQDSLRRIGENPQYFFRRSFFTWSHRKVVEAVATGLAEGGAVDGYIYESLRARQPELVAGTRIVSRSPDFGFPPFVAHRRVGESLFAAMRRVLLDMSANERGRDLLAQLNLDGFTAGDAKLFDSIDRMARLQQRSANVP